jgi:glyoxylase-like metal-dependent hydrolase (beta-lactamase superfamily II)
MAERDQNRILTIRMMTSNAYLVENGRKAILIDCGMKKKQKKILAALARMQLSPQDIQLIILTHTHYDHAGSIKALQHITKAKVLVHKEEAGCLEEGYCAFPKGTMWFPKIMSAIGRALNKWVGRYAPVTPDIMISKRFDLHAYGIDGYVLPTPGHTAGSLSVVIEKDHAIVGDTLFNIFKHSVFPPYANDQKRLLKSWKALLEIGCENFYPGHGKPFTRERLQKTYAEKKK